MDSSPPEKLVVHLAHYPQMRLALKYYTSPASNDDYYIAKLFSKTNEGCETTLVEVFVNKLKSVPTLDDSFECSKLSFRDTDFYVDEKDVPMIEAWLEKCRVYDQHHKAGTA